MSLFVWFLIVLLFILVFVLIWLFLLKRSLGKLSFLVEKKLWWVLIIFILIILWLLYGILFGGKRVNKDYYGDYGSKGEKLSCANLQQVPGYELLLSGDRTSSYDTRCDKYLCERLDLPRSAYITPLSERTSSVGFGNGTIACSVTFGVEETFGGVLDWYKEVVFGESRQEREQQTYGPEQRAVTVLTEECVNERSRVWMVDIKEYVAGSGYPPVGVILQYSAGDSPNNVSDLQVPGSGCQTQAEWLRSL